MSRLIEPVFDLRLPESWKHSWCRAFGSLGLIATAAISFRNFTVGFEVINGYARGFALVIGPLWLGMAYRNFARDTLSQGGKK